MSKNVVNRRLQREQTLVPVSNPMMMPFGALQLFTESTGKRREGQRNWCAQCSTVSQRDHW